MSATNLPDPQEYKFPVCSTVQEGLRQNPHIIEIDERYPLSGMHVSASIDPKLARETAETGASLMFHTLGNIRGVDFIVDPRASSALKRCMVGDVERTEFTIAGYEYVALGVVGIYDNVESQRVRRVQQILVARRLIECVLPDNCLREKLGATLENLLRQLEQTEVELGVAKSS